MSDSTHAMDDWGRDPDNYTNTGWKQETPYVPTQEEIEDYLNKIHEENLEDYQEENDNDYGEMPF